MFRGCSGGVPGCSGCVPGVFRVVPGVFRGVPGCSGVFRGVPGFTDTPINLQCGASYRGHPTNFFKSYN